ncbi:hypothetical protein SEA_WOOPER_22 [Gordonia phage Wooper]|nr:hypothetical protein SEA_WOOPER_22 [Gordonia phage Wooper]
MTSAQPVCTDTADPIVNAFIRAMREAFDDTSECPPIGGGSTTVRLFAGDAIPLAAWNAHSADVECDHPFLWVRLMRRYRTNAFPTPTIASANCDMPRVLAVEVGVGRCAVVDLEPSWEDYAREAEISIDDGWRIELALCRAKAFVLNEHLGSAFGTDIINPYGPEGGVIAMTGIGYVQF